MFHLQMAQVELPPVLPGNKTRTKLGEGAIFDPITNQLLFVDIVKGKIFAYDPESKALAIAPLRQSVGTIVPASADAVVVAANKGVSVVSRGDGRVLKFLGNPASEAQLPENRWNDGKCDPQGRLWVGSMNNYCDAHAGALYSVDGAGNFVKHIDKVTISNGLVWSADGTKFWFIDTAKGQVDEYGFDGASGTLTGGPRTAISLDAATYGYPDGCTIDAEDKIWIAMWGGGCVLRCDPASGAVLAKYELPGVTRVTSCAFGGPQLDQLFITTASCGADASLFESSEINAGALFRIDLSATPIRGVPAFVFKL